MPRRKKLDYDPKPLQRLLQRLLEKSGESYRKAAVATGLGPNAVSKYMRGVRPMRDACIALADHFGINPNEVLKAAGYAPLHFFDLRLIDPSALPPDVGKLAIELAGIEDEGLRGEMVELLSQILHFHMKHTAGISE